MAKASGDKEQTGPEACTPIPEPDPAGDGSPASAARSRTRKGAGAPDDAGPALLAWRTLRDVLVQLDRKRQA
jgi:hypothetical protein